MKKGRTNPTVAIALLLLLLLPLGSSRIQVLATAESATFGNALFVGDLAGISLEINQTTADFALEAERIVGTVQRLESPFVVNRLAVAPSEQHQDPIKAERVASAQLTPRGDWRLLILPLSESSAQVASGPSSGNLFPGELTNLVFPNYAATGDTVLPTAGKVKLVSQQGEIVILGNFRVVLWSATLTLNAAAGPQTITTGLDATSYAASPGVTAENTTSREAFLDVLNGTLRLMATPSLDIRTTNTQVKIDDGFVLLNGATGNLDVADRVLQLQNQEVRLQGKSELRLAMLSNGDLQAAVGGNSATVSVDGVIIRQPEGSKSSIFWIPLVGLVLIGAGGYGSYRYKWTTGLKQLDSLMEKEDYSGALDLATRLRWLPRIREDLTVAQGVCLLKLGRDEDAKQILNGNRNRPGAGRLFLLARIAAGEHRFEDAQKLLIQCFVAEPQYRNDALADPVLAPVLAQVAEGVLPEGYV